MPYPQGALPVFFGRGQKNDAQYLASWKNAPITYSPEQELDQNWNIDRYEVILGQDDSGELFRHAAELTLRNRFYPTEVMLAVSNFSLENRTVRTGDRVLQRIRIFQYNTLPIFEVLTMNVVTEVIDEPRRAGFTYTTTAAHSEVGEWSPIVEWRENGEVALIISVVSRPREGASDFSRRFTRRMQLRAHQLSIQNFRMQLDGRRHQLLQMKDPQSPYLLPMGMLVLALLLLIRTAPRLNKNR